MMLNKSIAAISTPFGKGGIAVIRISGSDSLSIAEKIFKPSTGKLSPTPRLAIYGNILSNGKAIDDGILTYYAGPNSFTGEDMIEISCHGGIVITSMVLESILSSGAIMAKPGEFTQRAFINGKLTLTRAEGIADLLDAKTESAALISSSSARGRLSLELSKISERILRLVSSLYAYIDYPDEDLQEISDTELNSEILSLEGICLKLINSFNTGKAVTEGIPTMIVGKPNVGKSSFFNEILGETKSIVTHISGTTRDIIEYPAKAGKVLLRLSDTAGVRSESTDVVERIGIDLVLDKLESGNAGLIYALFDGSRELDTNDYTLIERLKKTDAQIIPIITKSDLDRVIDTSILEKEFGELFYISVFNKTTLEEIINKTEKLFIDEKISLSDDAIITNARQKSCITKTKDLLGEAKKELLHGAKDICGILLEEALTVINETDGRGISELIVNEIFTRFCVGK